MKKLNQWINSKIFSMEFVLKLAIKFANMTINAVSRRAKINFRPTVYIQILKDFNNFETSSLQKGVSLDWVAGLTSLQPNYSVLIVFSYEAIRKQTFCNFPLFTLMQILGVIGHEAFHSCQMQWFLENKGSLSIHEVLDRLLQYNRSVEYNKNILEVGAEAWCASARVQNFSDLAIILH